MVEDLVCGMDVDPKTAAEDSEYQGQWCASVHCGCKRAFDKEPQKYFAEADSRTFRSPSLSVMD
jgi:YHS domain-containing protein